MELLLGNLTELCKLVHPGIVHEYVQGSKRFLRLGKEAPHVGCLGHIPLYRDCFATFSHDLGNYAIGTLLARSVIHHDGCALRRQALRNTRANSLRCTCNDCNFVLQSAHVSPRPESL